MKLQAGNRPIFLLPKLTSFSQSSESSSTTPLSMSSNYPSFLALLLHRVFAKTLLAFFSTFLCATWTTLFTAPSPSFSAPPPEPTPRGKAITSPRKKDQLLSMIPNPATASSLWSHGCIEASDVPRTVVSVGFQRLWHITMIAAQCQAVPYSLGQHLMRRKIPVYSLFRRSL